MQINGPDAQEQERRRMKRALVQIAAAEIDWHQGLITAEAAMHYIATILKDSKQ